MSIKSNENYIFGIWKCRVLMPCTRIPPQITLLAKKCFKDPVRREPIFRAELIDPFSRAETPMNRTPTNDLEAARPSVLDSRLRGTPTSTRGPCAAMSCRPAKEGVTNRERRINFSDRKFYTHSLPFLREFDRDYTLCSIHSVMIFCKVCLKCCTG